MPEDPFVAHDVPDLINTLPVLFGFKPEDSVVAIATHGPRHRMRFRMRLDLPGPEQVEDVAAFVVRHLRRNDAEGAILLAVTDDAEMAGEVVWAIENRLGDILPVVSAWADGERYWTTLDDCDPDGYPYEATDHHESVVRAVAAGQEILPSRDALAAKLDPFGGERRRWLDGGSATVAGQVLAVLRARGDLPVEEVALAAAHAGRSLTDDQALRLAWWAVVSPTRGALWELITPSSAPLMVGMWSQVSRCAPRAIRAPSLTLAGFASWLSGDGAFALIAVEKALDADPDFPMAATMLEVLERGIPPSTWRPLGSGEQASA